MASNKKNPIKNNTPIKPRRAWPRIKYNNTAIFMFHDNTVSPAKITKIIKGKANPNVGKELTKAITEFSYTDVANGQSDSVTITIHNINKEWLNKWFPRRGADFVAEIITDNWINSKSNRNVFRCGKFIMDDITFQGPMSTCTINGVSIPADRSLKFTPRTRTYTSTTVKEIIEDILKTRVGGVKLVYDAEEVKIDEIEQTKESDSSFIKGLCDKYDLSMKVYNDKIVVFDTSRYEQRKVVCSITKESIIDWTYNTTVEGTYTGVWFSYSNPDSNESINVRLGTTSRLYVANTQANTREDAEKQAYAKLNEANRLVETLTVTIFANPNLIASQCVKIKGLDRVSGKYYIDEITHNLGNGYTQTLKMHRVQPRLKNLEERN